jgi:hypothetical protein
VDYNDNANHCVIDDDTDANNDDNNNDNDCNDAYNDHEKSLGH